MSSSSSGKSNDQCSLLTHPRVIPLFCCSENQYFLLASTCGYNRVVFLYFLWSYSHFHCICWYKSIWPSWNQNGRFQSWKSRLEIVQSDCQSNGWTWIFWDLSTEWGAIEKGYCNSRCKAGRLSTEFYLDWDNWKAKTAQLILNLSCFWMCKCESALGQNNSLNSFWLTQWQCKRLLTMMTIHKKVLTKQHLEWRPSHTI